MKSVLVIDIGGTHVKVLATGQEAQREFDSGPTLTPKRMVSEVRKLVTDWKYDVVSIGYPGPVLQTGPLPSHGTWERVGWGSTFEAAFKRPVKVDQRRRHAGSGQLQTRQDALSWLRDGLGSAVIVDGIVEPMELGHLPYKKATYEDYVGLRGLEKTWQEEMAALCR